MAHCSCRYFGIAVSLVFSFLVAANANAQAPHLVEFFSGGKPKRGLALIELASEVVVLGRDGWLHSLDPRGHKGVRPVDGAYSPASATEMRAQLRREFGNAFEVIATQHFLVVQPRSRGKRWPDMFEKSHRGFDSYMSRRGVKVRQGRFPMVAVVYPDQRSMYAAFREQGIDVSRVAGLYSNNSNRVMTHDGGQIERIAATVRHEAAHQSAFNSGIHSRITDTPKWVSEGIGQLFEPVAVTDPRSGPTVQDRVNKESMWFILNKFPERSDPNFTRAVVDLLGSDKMFDSSKTVQDAYAIAWSMMFYLAERQPKEFAKILKVTNNRPSFRNYPRAERLKDFQDAVGLDVYDFGKRVNWYLHSLK